jgi:hypothetical protein
MFRMATTQAPLCGNCCHTGQRRRTRYHQATPCQACGRVVYLQVTRRRRRYLACSETCRNNLYREAYFRRKGPRTKECAVCGKAFTGKRSDSRTCSSACRQKAYRERVTATNYSPASNS